MLTTILIAIGGMAVLFLIAVIGSAAWVAHKMTVQERIPVSGHPSRLGLDWEDVKFYSRGDKVPLRGWYLHSDEDNRCVILIQGMNHHRNSPGIRTLRLGRDLVDRGFSALLFDVASVFRLDFHLLGDIQRKRLWERKQRRDKIIVHLRAAEKLQRIDTVRQNRQPPIGEAGIDPVVTRA